MNKWERVQALATNVLRPLSIPTMETVRATADRAVGGNEQEAAMVVAWNAECGKPDSLQERLSLDEIVRSLTVIKTLYRGQP